MQPLQKRCARQKLMTRNAAQEGLCPACSSEEGRASHQSMEIVIRDTHQRGKNKKKTLEVVETDTLESLKSRISEAFGIAPAAQSLQCYGRILIGDALTLESLGIKDEAVIIVTQPGKTLFSYLISVKIVPTSFQTPT